jgi:hypothetical protein
VPLSGHLEALSSNQRGKEVRLEDKMAASSQNGDIITLPIIAT